METIEVSGKRVSDRHEFPTTKRKALTLHNHNRRFAMKKNELTLSCGPMPKLIDAALPESKSIENRLLIMKALAGVPFAASNPGECDDTAVLRRALTCDCRDCRIDIGAAGTAMRFLTAYFAAKPDARITLDGSPRMRRRPIRILVDALRSCGADIDYGADEGFPPLHIAGKPLRSKLPLDVQGDISSQYISALMMIAPCMETGLAIRLSGAVVSTPYIEMTAALMRKFGARVNINTNEIRVDGTGYKPADIDSEKDWSAASYWYELKSLLPESEIRLHGLRADSVQGDKRIEEIFRLFGVDTVFDNDGATLKTGNFPRVKSFSLDLAKQPDLAQTIAVAACLNGIPYRLTGLSTLKIKETDRIEALKSQLLKLGFIVESDADCSLSWDGERISPENVPEIETFDDHRMAMAFAPAALRFPKIKICNPEVVAKSYPSFWQELSKAGFKMEEEWKQL